MLNFGNRHVLLCAFRLRFTHHHINSELAGEASGFALVSLGKEPSIGPTNPSRERVAKALELAETKFLTREASLNDQLVGMLINAKLPGPTGEHHLFNEKAKLSSFRFP